MLMYTCYWILYAILLFPLYDQVDALPEEQVRYMTDKIPMRRTGEIEELAALVEYIASPEARYQLSLIIDLRLFQ